MNANFLPAAATDVQLMVPCQWLMSTPSIVLPGAGVGIGAGVGLGFGVGVGVGVGVGFGVGVGAGAAVTAVLNSPFAAYT